jgi:hypothetical protein
VCVTRDEMVRARERGGECVWCSSSSSSSSSYTTTRRKEVARPPRRRQLTSVWMRSWEEERE